MAYIQDWERLSDALSRVKMAGFNEREAKRDICSAIADGKIDVRFLVAKDEGGIGLGPTLNKIIVG
jgi:hypothetical protein